MLGGASRKGRIMGVSKHNFARQQRSVVAMRAGVSLAALLAAGISGNAWAQAETQPIAPDTAQAAAPAQKPSPAPQPEAQGAPKSGA